LRLQIDVGFGDAITPAPTIAEFPSILDQPRQCVQPLNVEEQLFPSGLRSG
jgi:hypothetical protein